MEDLIKALRIFEKYCDDYHRKFPFCCDHDIIVMNGAGKMWIDLFEVKKGKYRTGIGTEMFKLLMEKHTPLYVKLECVEEEDKEKQAHHFWRKMGFHKTYDKTVFDDGWEVSGDVFVKKYTKKYWKNHDKL